MGWVITLVTSLICVGVILGGKVFAKRQLVGSAKIEKDKLVAAIENTLNKLKGFSNDTDSFVSQAQFETLASQVETARKMLEKEKDTLLEIEANLDKAQKSVEEKEAIQQDLKSSNEEEDAILEELLTNYSGIAEESALLEKQLAESLKSLDRIMSELKLTDEQRALLEELQRALTVAGANLRDLLMEYEAVKSRLENLKQQHLDLEDEYTKLVEQQLGE